MVRFVVAIYSAICGAWEVSTVFRLYRWLGKSVRSPRFSYFFLLRFQRRLCGRIYRFEASAFRQNPTISFGLSRTASTPTLHLLNARQTYGPKHAAPHGEPSHAHYWPTAARSSEPAAVKSASSAAHCAASKAQRYPTAHQAQAKPRPSAVRIPKPKRSSARCVRMHYGGPARRQNPQAIQQVAPSRGSC